MKSSYKVEKDYVILRLIRMRISTMNCSELLDKNYIPTVWEVFDALGNIGICLISVTGIATALIFVIFFHESIYLFHHWPRQQCILTLLCLNTFPFAAGGFFISIVFPNVAETAKTIILLYLPASLVVYFRLTINYGGGENIILRKLFGLEMVLQGPPLCCLCFCCDKPPLTRRKFYFLKCSIYQLALTPILLTTAKYIGIEYGIFTEGSLSPCNAAPYISAISAVSMMFGVYSLVIFSRIAAASIKDFQIIHKFVPLQANFLLIRLQVILFSIVGRLEAFPCIYPVSSTVTGHYIRSAVIIGEAFILAVLARGIFLHPPPYSVWPEQSSVCDNSSVSQISVSEQVSVNSGQEQLNTV